MFYTITNSTDVILNGPAQQIFDERLTRLIDDFEYDRRWRELEEIKQELRKVLTRVYRPPPVELPLATLPIVLFERRPLRARRGVVWLARTQGHPRVRRARRRRLRAWERGHAGS